MKKNFFSGEIRLRVEGLNLDRFLNELVNKGVEIYALTREEHKKMSFSVPFRMRDRVAEIAKDRPYNVTEISSRGLPALIRGATKRLALIISLTVVFAAVTVFNAFIWDVRVLGLKDIKLSEVQKALAEAGFSTAYPKSSMDRGKLENALLAKIPQVSYVNVFYKGITLFIEIVEALPKEVTISREPRDLVAASGGVITRIVTISGTPAVKVGDTVSAGQILISRFVTYADESVKEVRADGEVYAEVIHEGEAAFFGSEKDFEKNLDSLKKTALERAQNSLPQGSCLISTNYDIIDTITGKVVKAILLVERRIDS